MSITEQQLLTWSRPISTTEDDKCKNAVSQVTQAIRNKFGYAVTIFLQGSYENNTNVRQDSDVDIIVRHDGYFYPDLQRLSDADKAIHEANRIPGGYNFSQLKDDIFSCLGATFGTAVQRKNKCIEVKGNTTRITADVVACFVLKRFATLTTIEAEGIQLYNEQNNDKIVSFPEQHNTNGIAKTNATGRMYKRNVRILKVIRNKLIETNVITDELVSSFFIECLVYNIPNVNFIPGNYIQTLRNVLTKTYSDMRDATVSNNYIEVSGLKWLFRGGKRTPQNAELFILKCWEYAGF